jgi:hypothetical protein
MPKQLKPYVPPFTIAIDSNEGHPWTFQGIMCDPKQAQTINGERHLREIGPEIEWKSLGRYPHSRGDYSIVGLESHVAIERKSVEDAWGTFLGYGGEKEDVSRTEMFERELANLADMEAAAVFIEASIQNCMAQVPTYSHKPPAVLSKTFHRRVIALIQDYGVPFMFWDTRRLAEISAYRYLERFYRKWEKQDDIDHSIDL